jgi:FKBP-type peptidyl-prolyl cis-trans isomerase FkpA
MKKIAVLVALFASLSASAQDTGDFRQSTGGMSYKIISAGSSQPLVYSSFLEISFRQTYNDSVLASSEDYGNQLAALDSFTIPANIFAIFTQCRKGDSIAMRMATDSIFRDGSMPPFIRSGGYIITGYKIMDVFTDKASADARIAVLTAQSRAKAAIKAEAQMQKDDKIITDYLAANSINAVKIPVGVYMQTLVPGSGKKVDKNSTVKINYTVKNFAGKTFDSNTDAAFGHVEPYEVTMWQPQVIAGWVESLPYFATGTKAKLYVPSSLAYGPQGNGDIGPNEVLIFDMEVVKITQRPAAAPAKPTKPAAPKKKTAPVKAKKPVKK